MTTLFIATGACSFGAHVVVEEFALPVDLVNVKLRDPASPIFRINPLGRVPSLVTDDDQLITENVAVLAWLGDLSSDYEAFAAPHTVARAQIQAWLAFLASEVHAGAFRLFNRATSWSDTAAVQAQLAAIGERQVRAAFRHIDEALVGKRYLVDDRFTLADAYLGVFLNWSGRIPGLLDDYAQLSAFLQRYNARPAVKRARETEAQQAARAVAPASV